MYKKILVPLDGSEFAESVLSHVKTIASDCKTSEVVLLFVVEPSVSVAFDVPVEWLDEAKKKGLDFARDYLNQIAADLEKSGVTVSCKVKEGISAETILSCLKTDNIDLLIISTHGRSGITRWVFGSVADKVIHHSSVPVLIVTPSGARPVFKK
jgi:nucleotide-binding universal stress UspA family protein